MRASWWVPARSAVVAALVAAHVAGHGWAMLRDWFNAGGTGATGQDNLAVVLSSAAVVMLAGTTAAMTTAADRWRLVPPARPGYVALGVAVAVLVPLMWDVPESQDAVPLGRSAWMYSLPWGAGLAAIGWLRGRAAVVVGVTVAVSAAVFAALVVGTEALEYLSRTHEDHSTPPAGD